MQDCFTNISSHLTKRTLGNFIFSDFVPICLWMFSAIYDTNLSPSCPKLTKTMYTLNQPKKLKFYIAVTSLETRHNALGSSENTPKKIEMNSAAEIWIKTFLLPTSIGSCGLSLKIHQPVSEVSSLNFCSLDKGRHCWGTLNKDIVQESTKEK